MLKGYNLHFNGTLESPWVLTLDFEIVQHSVTPMAQIKCQDEPSKAPPHTHSIGGPLSGVGLRDVFGSS